jgi:ankyrin repeat protein
MYYHKAGWTPLHFAAKYGHETIADLLIERGAVIEAKDNGGWTPLHFAIIFGHEDLASKLLHNGADPNVKNKVRASRFLGLAGCAESEH